MTDLKASSLRALKLMDLTTLNDDDTDEKVIALCHQAKTPVGNWICPYISRHLLSLNPLLACCRRYSRGER